MANWAMLALSLLVALGAPSPDFLTRPDIHGDQVVFTAAGDLWEADVRTGTASRLTSDPGIESAAHFSPDGRRIAFTAQYDGGNDAYVMPADGGEPKRLTYAQNAALTLGWTPDGQRVLYRSADGSWNRRLLLYTVNVRGGLPVKVAVPQGDFAAFNADNNRLAYVPDSNEWMNWFRYQGGEADAIWLVDLAKGVFTKLTDSGWVDTEPVWVGDTIYFVSERSGVRNLWRLDPTTKKVAQVTFSTRAPVRYPSTDGKRVVFELGARIGMYDPADGKTTVLPIRLTSDELDVRETRLPVAANLQGASLGPTGKRVALEARGHLLTVPATSGVPHVIVSDSAQRAQLSAWSPDGKQLAYVSDPSGGEQLYLAPSAGGAPRQLTRSLTGEHFRPIWTPDGKYLALGDRAGDIQLVDAETGEVSLVRHCDHVGAYDQSDADYAASPDGRWLAISQVADEWIPRVWLYEIATGKRTLVSDPTIASTSPSFSPDGKYLYMLQARHLNPQFDAMASMIAYDDMVQVTGVTLAKTTLPPNQPKDDEEGVPAPKTPAAKPPAPVVPAPPIAVDLDGIAARTFDPGVPPGRYTKLRAIEGKFLLLDATEPGRLTGDQPLALTTFDLATKALATIASPASDFEVSQNGEKLLVQGPGRLQVLSATTGPAPAAEGAVSIAGLTITVDPRKEWRQIFEEGWRAARDFFYDPNMHGVDWDAVRLKYEARLPSVGSRPDLTRLQADMLSELNTGHCYVGGPSPFQHPATRVGSLGADLAWDPLQKGFRIAHILRGNAWDVAGRSPLAGPGLGIADGDFLLAIDGHELRADEDPRMRLLGKAGALVTLKVGPNASGEGAREVRVKVLASDAELRYQDWVASRQAYVAKATDGQAAYVHVRDMEGAGAIDFASEFYPNAEKPAVIVDVRSNGGGDISMNLLDHLRGFANDWFSSRGSAAPWRRDGWTPAGYVVGITDEWAFSDGEFFSEFFKRLKVGPLVGHRTGGGEVGSGGGYGFMDGGSIFVPSYAAWTGKEWIVEGRGVTPDYPVDQDPAAVMAGKDPQLDKAIELAMAYLKAHPPVKPVHPPYPIKLGGSAHPTG